MASSDLLVRFWGVRGSYPVPGAKTMKVGGNTSCVEVQSRTHRIILDCGTGIIKLGEHILVEHQKQHPNGSTPLQLSILLSHTHHDHIQGLPFFQPAYKPYASLYIFGPQLLGVDLRESISETMTARYCPVRLEELNAHKVIENMANNDRLLFQNNTKVPQLYSERHELPKLKKDDLLVRVMRSYAHPKDGVFVYRIENNGSSVVYATDTEGYQGGDARLIKFAQGADLLIHDAQYTNEEYTTGNPTKQGFGHSTTEMACEVATKAKVKQLVLCHHDPGHDDNQMLEIEKRAKSLFKESQAAREGMEISI
jgi:phosphoribosyl 1,2-cyclic phosphodiesterase